MNGHEKKMICFECEKSRRTIHSKELARAIEHFGEVIRRARGTDVICRHLDPNLKPLTRERKG